MSQLCRSSVTGSCCREMTPHFTRSRSLSPRDGLQCDPGLCTPCPPGGLLQPGTLPPQGPCSVCSHGRACPFPQTSAGSAPLLLCGAHFNTLFKNMPPRLPCHALSLFVFFYKATLHILTAYLVTYLSHLLLLLAELCGMWDPSSLTRI